MKYSKKITESESIIYNKYIYAIIIMAIFVILLGGCEDAMNRNIDTNISKIAKNDGVNKSIKIINAIIDKNGLSGLYAMSNEEIENYYGTEITDTKDYSIYSSLFTTSATEIAIVDIGNEDNEKKIIERFNYRIESLKDKWKGKDAKEYFKIRNAIVKITNSYAILVIEDKANDVAENIEDTITKLVE